jgi:hypothetical protein
MSISKEPLVRRSVGDCPWAARRWNICGTFALGVPGLMLLISHHSIWFPLVHPPVHITPTAGPAFYYERLDKPFDRALAIRHCRRLTRNGSQAR